MIAFVFIGVRNLPALIVLIILWGRSVDAQTQFGVSQGWTVNVKMYREALGSVPELVGRPLKIDHGVDLFLPRPNRRPGFARIDSIMSLCEEFDLRPIVVLGYAKDLMGRFNPRFSESVLDSFMHVAPKAIRRYVEQSPAGSITFESWGEPNEFGYWNGTVDSYADMFCALYDTVKQIGPDIPFGGPALSGVQPRKLDWLRQFMAAVKRRNVTPDFISLHLYGISRMDLAKGIEKVRGMSREYFGVILPVYVTEWNATWKPESNPGSLVAEQESIARILARSEVAVAAYHPFMQISRHMRGVCLLDSKGEASPFWPTYKRILTSQ